MIIYETATSLDGWIADDENSLSWLFPVPGGDDPRLAAPDASVQVMGSTTYEWVLRHIGAMESAGAWKEAFGSTRVVVFTHRDLPIPADAQVQLVSGSVRDVLPEIREAATNGTIWVVGGGDLAGQFADVGALDEIRLSVAPVALGGGAPLLPRRLDSTRLHLVGVEHVGGFARLTYSVSAAPDDAA